jgi:hypothetical protein
VEIGISQNYLSTRENEGTVAILVTPLTSTSAKDTCSDGSDQTFLACEKQCRQSILIYFRYRQLVNTGGSLLGDTMTVHVTAIFDLSPGGS